MVKINLQIDKLRSLFLDLDLAILASEKYSEYAANIRKEYEHVPKAEYRDARVKILESFLQKAENNELFKVLTNKNKPAVANLTWELIKLSLTI
jgi:predicted metal-dependent HD superfamily phosphohydrolase